MAKILTTNDTIYSRYYGGFRGVDFSSDHTQVQENRLAYLVNMFKDYQSGQGQALETVAGFRRRVELPEEAEVYGFFYFKDKDNDGNVVKKVLIHAGDKLWLWHNYPHSINIEKTNTIIVPVVSSTVNGISVYAQSFTAAQVTELKTQRGSDLTVGMEFNSATKMLTYASYSVKQNDTLIIKYKEGVITDKSTPLFARMNKAKSISFIFNNRLYILDGVNYLVYDGTSVLPVAYNAYIPTTYKGIVPVGENANSGEEHEQRNILQSKFKHTFVANGENKKFALNENSIDCIVEVKLYGVVVAEENYDTDLANGSITFKTDATAPTAPMATIQIPATKDTLAVHYEEGYAGVEITASKEFESVSGVTEKTTTIAKLITKCTLAATYDGRVFVTGNPNYPNHIFYCGRNSTGYADPSYFGVLNKIQDGVGLAPITGIMSVSDTLMVLKADTQQDATVYFHTGVAGDSDINPRLYPSSEGLGGLGCVGACINFLDDPIFISRLGIEAVGQLSVRLERATEHRSSLIDTKLVNNDLSKALLEEWGGYLCVLLNGKMYLADSRQVYQHSNGMLQYEWYYLDGIGVYKDQYIEYCFSSVLPEELQGMKVPYDEDEEELSLELASSVCFSYENEVRDLRGEIANPPNNVGATTSAIHTQTVDITINERKYTWGIYYKVHEVRDIYTNEIVERHAYLCESKDNYTGGTFEQATTIRSMDDNLFFGTKNGVICSFNFDKRDPYGEISSQYYSFDKRTIVSGCATLMDNCAIPHLIKTTIKRSTVIKTKSFRNSAAKIKVRTNRKAYEQIARINNSLFSFEDMNFADFTFKTTEQSLYAIREKEKHWMEKQYYIYSDEYMRPFALYYISFRYKITGRLKA